jgi:hypothetical protein
MELPASVHLVPPFTLSGPFISQSRNVLRLNDAKGGTRVAEATTRPTKLESFGFFGDTLD